MKKNSPGCTCCKPVVFGNQQLWTLANIKTGAGYLTYNGMGQVLPGTTDADITMDVPEWVQVVNVAVAGVPDITGNYGSAVLDSGLATHPVGFYHELS